MQVTIQQSYLPFPKPGPATVPNLFAPPPPLLPPANNNKKQTKKEVLYSDSK